MLNEESEEKQQATSFTSAVFSHGRGKICLHPYPQRHGEEKNRTEYSVVGSVGLLLHDLLHIFSNPSQRNKRTFRVRHRKCSSTQERKVIFSSSSSIFDGIWMAYHWSSFYAFIWGKVMNCNGCEKWLILRTFFFSNDQFYRFAMSYWSICTRNGMSVLMFHFQTFAIICVGSYSYQISCAHLWCL